MNYNLMQINAIAQICKTFKCQIYQDYCKNQTENLMNNVQKISSALQAQKNESDTGTSIITENASSPQTTKESLKEWGVTYRKWHDFKQLETVIKLDDDVQNLKKLSITILLY